MAISKSGMTSSPIGADESGSVSTSYEYFKTLISGEVTPTVPFMISMRHDGCADGCNDGVSIG